MNNLKEAAVMALDLLESRSLDPMHPDLGIYYLRPRVMTALTQEQERRGVGHRLVDLPHRS
jgi:hypothetical protein